MSWAIIASSAAWMAAGVGVAAAIRPLGYHFGTWVVVGLAMGPLTLAVWGVRRTRSHPGPMLLEAGSPSTGEVDLLVIPWRGPTPGLVRALTELRGTRRRVTVARILPFDAPRRELAEASAHLAADRDALGVRSAELVLLFGAPARAVATYAAVAGVTVALVDGIGPDLRGRVGPLRVLTPDDVPSAERRDSVRVLASPCPVARAGRITSIGGVDTAS